MNSPIVISFSPRRLFDRKEKCTSMTKRIRIFATCLLVVAASVSWGEARGDEYSDGMKSYRASEIKEALEFFIAKVLSNPKHQKSVDMIKELLPRVVAERTAAAKKYQEAEEWDLARKEYDRLARLDRVLQGLVAYDDGVPITFQRIEAAGLEEKATENAAEQYYLKGVEAMQTPGNSEAAVDFFKEARKFDPDFRDAKLLSAQALYNDGLMLIEQRDFRGAVRVLWRIRNFYPDGFSDSETMVQQAIDSAKVKIAVMPFDDLTFRARFGDVGASLSSEVVASGVSANPVFVEFLTRDFLQSILSEQDFAASERVDAASAPAIGKLAGVQMFLIGKVTGVTPNYPALMQESGESRAIAYRDKREIPLYARWTKYRRVGEVTVTANYQLVEVKSGRILESKPVSYKATSVAQWVWVVGDQDALDKSVVSFNTTGDVPIQPSEILAGDALRVVGKRIASEVLEAYEE